MKYLNLWGKDISPSVELGVEISKIVSNNIVHMVRWHFIRVKQK